MKDKLQIKQPVAQLVNPFAPPKPLAIDDDDDFPALGKLFGHQGTVFT